MFAINLCLCHLAASIEQIDKAKEIIKKLTFNFQSDAFENPGKKLCRIAHPCITHHIRQKPITQREGWSVKLVYVC